MVDVAADITDRESQPDIKVFPAGKSVLMQKAAISHREPRLGLRQGHAHASSVSNDLGHIRATDLCQSNSPFETTPKPRAFDVAHGVGPSSLPIEDRTAALAAANHVFERW